MTNIDILAQATIDIVTYFLTPFAIILAVTWAFSFFRKD